MRLHARVSHRDPSMKTRSSTQVQQPREFHMPHTTGWIALFALMLAAQAAWAAERFDVVLQGGRVVDGTGAPWYVADVGVRDGKIARIGRIDADAAKRVIDAKGLIVAPGFIDMMGQTATPMLRDPKAAMNLLTQGITTINAGEGASAAPARSASRPSGRLADDGRVFSALGYQRAPDQRGPNGRPHAGAADRAGRRRPPADRRRTRPHEGPGSRSHGSRGDRHFLGAHLPAGRLRRHRGAGRPGRRRRPIRRPLLHARPQRRGSIAGSDR